MPRKNRDGKYILSASEIGSYTVCPESWRLRSVVRVNAKEDNRVEKGQMKHQEWTATLDEQLFLARGTRIILALLVLALAAFILLGKHSIILS